VVPADCEWVEGDEMLVDTSALTGESIPRKVPDKNNHRVLLSGFVVRAGECLASVKSTGLRTEMGEAAALVHAASERDTQGVFEQKIMNVCEVVIFLTLVITAIIIFVQIYGKNQLSYISPSFFLFFIFKIIQDCGFHFSLIMSTLSVTHHISVLISLFIPHPHLLQHSSRQQFRPSDFDGAIPGDCLGARRLTHGHANYDGHWRT